MSGKAGEGTAPAAGAAAPGKREISDFLVGTQLGEGAYARVFVCKLKSSGERYAVKVMEKKFIVKEKKMHVVTMERKVLSMVNHPNIMRLYFSFHDAEHLYMVMDLCSGGELWRLIRFHRDRQESELGRKNRAIPVDLARFYMAESTSAVQYLHSVGIVHRDVKPENLLLTADGHIKLTDFGTAKDEGAQQQQQQQKQQQSQGQDTGRPRKDTFCGTAEYVSPEVLQDQEASTGADLWALGCLLYVMLVGKPPFRAASEYLTFQRILEHGKRELLIPTSTNETVAETDDSDSADAQQGAGDAASSPFAAMPVFALPAPQKPDDPDPLPEAAMDLVRQLLLPDPSARLGASGNRSQQAPDARNGANALRAHRFFKGLDFEKLSEARAPKLPFDANSIPEPTIDGSSDEWLLAPTCMGWTRCRALTRSLPRTRVLRRARSRC